MVNICPNLSGFLSNSQDNVNGSNFTELANILLESWSDSNKISGVDIFGMVNICPSLSGFLSYSQDSVNGSKFTELANILLESWSDSNKISGVDIFYE